MRAFVEVDNKSEYIHDNDSIVDLVEEKMGSEMGSLIRNLVNEHRDLTNFEEKRENEALDEYEGIIDSQSDALSQVFHLNRDLMSTLEEDKRMNRKKILNVLYEMGNILSNEI